ncbi:hypothetical protein ARTHRO8AJ_40008 [Arthrobacter sp. 8AJ]|nr:hypothetical protein ARTHRO8AJ_40008 [Arthrobacter sp. 8AJ]
METMRPAGQQKTRAFGRDLSCIEEVLSGVKNSLGTSPTSISGECREPKRTGTDWYFELADIQNGKVHVLPARIEARNAATISRYLQGRGTSITQALQTGNLLELEATPTLDRRKKLILDVTKYPCVSAAPALSTFVTRGRCNSLHTPVFLCAGWIETEYTPRLVVR